MCQTIQSFATTQRFNNEIKSTHVYSCLHIHNTASQCNFGGSVFGNGRNSDNNGFQGAAREYFMG